MFLFAYIQSDEMSDSPVVDMGDDMVILPLGVVSETLARWNCSF